jgi:hypothetical protein
VKAGASGFHGVIRGTASTDEVYMRDHVRSPKGSHCRVKSPTVGRCAEGFNVVLTIVEKKWPSRSRQAIVDLPAS